MDKIFNSAKGAVSHKKIYLFLLITGMASYAGKNHILSGLITIYLSAECQIVENVSLTVPESLRIDSLKCAGENKEVQFSGIMINMNYKGSKPSLNLMVREVSYSSRRYVKFYPLKFLKKLKKRLYHQESELIIIKTFKIDSAQIKYSRNYPKFYVKDLSFEKKELKFLLHTSISNYPFAIDYQSNIQKEISIFFKNNFYNVSEIKKLKDTLIFPEFKIENLYTNPSFI